MDEGLAPPPTRPSNRETLSTRSLNQLYRESRGEAFFAGNGAEPLPSPTGSYNRPVSHAGSSHNSQGGQRPMSLHENSQRRRTASNHMLDRPASRTSQYSSKRPGSVHSGPSIDAAAISLAGLDVTDPWGFSFRSDSPYDALLPPPPPIQSSGRRGSRSPSSLRSVSYSSMDWIPEQAQEEQAYLSRGTGTVPAASSTVSLGRGQPEGQNIDSRRRVASMTDLPTTAAATLPQRLRSNLQHVRNNDESREGSQNTPKPRKFSWFRSLSSRSVTPSANQTPLDDASSATSLTASSSLRSVAQTTGDLRTPPLSISTSSAASSSFDAHSNLETVSTNTSSFGLDNVSVQTDSPPLEENRAGLVKSLSSSVQTVRRGAEDSESVKGRKSKSAKSMAKTDESESDKPSKVRRMSLAFSRKSKKASPPPPPTNIAQSNAEDTRNIFRSSALPERPIVELPPTPVSSAGLLQSLSLLTLDKIPGAAQDNAILCEGPARQIRVSNSQSSLRPTIRTVAPSPTIA